MSVEIDGQLAEIAESQLESAGYRAVGCTRQTGVPVGRRTPRTTGSSSRHLLPDPEPSWVEQLARPRPLVVPLAREREAVMFDKAGATSSLRDGSCPALFIPMR